MKQGTETNPLQAKHFHCPENDDFYGSGIYQSLNTDEFSIRLLKAVPPDRSKPDAILQFTLHQPVLLSSTVPNSPTSQPFIAMLYRAGDPADTLPILINGQRFNVFRSLGLGLRRLLDSLGRERDDLQLEETLYIWADQICINQSDAVEKAAQVRNMCTIYEACSWAYSWLGPDPDIDRGLLGMNRVEYVQKIIADALGDEGKRWGDISHIDGELYIWTVGALEKLEKMEVDWESVSAFLNNEYWTRGWVYQEITVSPDVTYNTATAENDRAGLAAAFRLLSLIRRCLRWDFELRGEELVPKSVNTQAPDIDKMIPWAQKLRWLHEIDLAPFTFLLETSENWKETEGYPLNDLMLAARRSVVSDPVDRVYAFLGLALPGYNIIPDYSPSKTTTDLFVEATVAWITLQGALDVLSFAEERTQQLGPQLPSWVSDWSFPYATMSLWHRWQGDKRRPRASGNFGYGLVLLPHEDQKDRVLEVSSITVDTIENVRETVGGPVSHYRTWEHALAAWARIARIEIERGYSEVNNTSYQYVEGISLAVAFWSTVFRGLKTPKFTRKLWRVMGKRHAGGEGIEGESESEESDEEEGPPTGVEGEEWEDVEEDSEGDAAGDESLEDGEEEKGNDRQQRQPTEGSQDKKDGGEEANESLDDEKATDDAEEEYDGPPVVFEDYGSGLAQHHLAMAAVTDQTYITKAGWRFFHSQQGYFGLTRVNVQEGDIIMVLMGADMPFILRPYLGGYKLAGEAYVHGIMHGELVRKFEDPEGDDLPARKIRLY